jgi:lysophospholipase L1-like esterase
LFKIVALGGSNTFGFPEDKIQRSEAYPSQLAALLRKGNIDAEVINSGMPGKRTDEMLAALDEKVPVGATHVVFQTGGNDHSHGVSDQIRNRNIEAIKLALEKQGIRVLIWEHEEMAGLPRQDGDPRHLTPKGYQMLAERLVPRIVTLLRSQSSGIS